jgi:hypothetical protein
MGVTILLFRISQPKENLFKAQIARLLKECKVLHGLRYKVQSGVIHKREAVLARVASGEYDSSSQEESLYKKVRSSP